MCSDRPEGSLPPGNALVGFLFVVFSHIQVYYMWFALAEESGFLWFPDAANLQRFGNAFLEKATPDARYGIKCFVSE